MWNPESSGPCRPAQKPKLLAATSLAEGLEHQLHHVGPMPVAMPALVQHGVFVTDDLGGLEALLQELETLGLAQDTVGGIAGIGDEEQVLLLVGSPVTAHGRGQAEPAPVPAGDQQGGRAGQGKGQDEGVVDRVRGDLVDDDRDCEGPEHRQTEQAEDQGWEWLVS